MTREQLKRRWDLCFHELGARAGTENAFEDVLVRYREPHRAYHTLRHIAECFDGFDDARHLMASPGAVAAAIWFHDAVYDTNARNNELNSAAMTERVLRAAGVAWESIAAVKVMIVDTKHDAEPGPGDATLLVDIDLAILGASAERFAEYEAQIRAEYAWVDGDTYRSTRRRILEGLFARRAIYGSDYFRSRLEQQARHNLRGSIRALSAK